MTTGSVLQFDALNPLTIYLEAPNFMLKPVDSIALLRGRVKIGGFFGSRALRVFVKLDRTFGIEIHPNKSPGISSGNVGAAGGWSMSLVVCRGSITMPTVV